MDREIHKGAPAAELTGCSVAGTISLGGRGRRNSKTCGSVMKKQNKKTIISNVLIKVRPQ